MVESRRLPLFDVALGSWNERMVAGEYAVHYSNFESGTPYCTVFGSLLDAVAHAEHEVLRRPTLCCMIYDHQGKIGAPVREIRGKDFKANEITSRFRRWAGSFLFFVGAVLTCVDWAADFKYMWPSTVGMRMAVPGATLLVIEGLVMLHARTSGSAVKKEHA